MVDYNVTVAMSGTPNPAGWHNVKAYGAVGDGSTDDSAAIEAAASAAATANGVLYFPSGQFAIDSATHIASGCDVIMVGEMLYTGSGSEVAVTVGEAGTANERRRIQIRLNRDAETLWSGDTSVGLKLFNGTNCYYDIALVKWFTTGLQCIGDGGGFSYNTINLGHMNGCKNHIELTNENSGWCNENNFFGGRLSNFTTGLNLAADRTGIKITSVDDAYVNNNDNTFYGTSIEIDPTNTTGTPLPIHIEHGSMNEFKDLRMEFSVSPGADVALVENASSRNVIHVGYDNVTGTSANYTDTSTSRSTIIKFRRLETNENTRASWNSGPLAAKAYEYSGAGGVAVRGLHIGSSGRTTVSPSDTGITVSGSSLVFTTVGRTVGTFVDTVALKRFLVRRNITDPAKPGRVAIRCYDAAGAILEDPGGAGESYYVKGLPHAPLTYVAADKWYKLGSDSAWDTFFWVHDDVKFVGVEIGAATAETSISSFSIESIDRLGSITAWPGITNVILGQDHDVPLALAAPATAATGIKYEAGMRIYNKVPAVGQPQGWVCLTWGTPGTWQALPNL